MVMSLIQTQGITLLILVLFLLQKNGRLEKEEGKSLLGWLGNLVIANWLIICVFNFQSTPFNLLMLASVNGLGTIAYLFLQRITFQKICLK